jgi:hypothetical protein
MHRARARDGLIIEVPGGQRQDVPRTDNENAAMSRPVPASAYSQLSSSAAVVHAFMRIRGSTSGFMDGSA